MKKSHSQLQNIDDEDFIYSHTGEACARQFLYLLNQKKHLDDLIKGIKPKKAMNSELISDKDIYNFNDDFDKDEYDDDIFDEDYEIKYQKEKEEKNLKYMHSKNSCNIKKFESNQDTKNSKLNKDKDKEKNSKEKNSKEKNKEISQNKAEREKQLMYELENQKFKYHLMHHHHDLWVDKSLLNLNDQVSSNSYKPKLNYIFRKIIYSPEFQKMSGRYDVENLRNKIEKKKDLMHKIQKEKEYADYQKKLKQIRTSVFMKKMNNESLDNDYEEEEKSLKRNQYMNDNFYSKKSSSNISLKSNTIGDLILSNESRNINKKLLKKSNSLAIKAPIYLSYGMNNKTNKSNFDIISNIEEESKENDIESNTYEGKKNISNNNENTLSTINHQKTTSARKKLSSAETVLIYPNIMKKETDNILIDDYSYQKSLKSKKSMPALNFHYLMGLKRDVPNYSNNSSKRTSKNRRIKSQGKNYSKSSTRKLKNSSSVKVLVNFEKMVSREPHKKSTEPELNIYSSLSPNFDAIRPKCIMKVVYARKHYKKNRAKEFKSDFNQIVFDINKSYNKYNNHFPPKNIYLGKMTGRKTDDTSLPSYMMDQYNRNSVNIFNEKSLKMNNYANGELLRQRSSFNEKGTFNYKLSEQYKGGDDNGIVKGLNTVYMKITRYPFGKKLGYGENKSLSCPNNESSADSYNKYINSSLMRSRMPEYYKVNLDKFGKYPFSYGEKIDGFTLKTIKSNKSAINLLTESEKRIFLTKLD